MLHVLNGLLAPLAPAVMARATLLVNHVLSSESVATTRLKPHSGKQVRLVLQAWPQALPAPPRLCFAVTPAGLFEWLAPSDAAQGGVASIEPELTLTIDASNPARVLMQTFTGQRPQATIEGDAALAADLNWLAQNLRWDVAADLERVFPAQVSHALHSLGSSAVAALRAAFGPAQRAP